jgi:hypothetical protein
VQASGTLLQCIEGLESFYSLIDGVYARNQATFEPVKLQTAHQFEYVGTILWFLYGIYAAKYRELLQKQIRSTLGIHKRELEAMAEGPRDHIFLDTSAPPL